MADKKLISKLVETKLWGDRSAKIGLRAKFRCEYCGKYLLENIESYKEWQEDHIIPLSKGGKDEIDNIALSCRFCNMVLKKKWNPNEDEKKLTRQQLIMRVIKHLEEVKKIENDKLEIFRSIIIENSDIDI